jgi:anti-sigma factor RsiW
MNAQHLSIDELADAAEGLLEEDRAAFVELHLAGCAECRASSAGLNEPPVVAAVSSRDLGAEASALERASGA